MRGYSIKFLMKKFLYLVIGLVVLAAFGSQTVAQNVVNPTVAQVDQATPTPDFTFGSFALLVAVIPLVVEVFKRLLRLKNSKVVQVVSWATGLGVTALVWTFNIGFVAGLPWYQMLIVGLFASLSSNGIYDIGIYTGLLRLIGIKSSVNEPPNQNGSLAYEITVDAKVVKQEVAKAVENIIKTASPSLKK